MTSGTVFAAKVSEWVANTKGALKAVRDEAAQRVIIAANTPIGQGGNLPVDTGFLWSSGHTSINGQFPELVPNPKSGSHTWEPNNMILTIQGADLKDTITFAYAANYAIYQEYKHRFVGLAVQQWPQIVDQVCKEAKFRYG